MHDLVEVYAGDTPAVQKGYEEAKRTKQEREEKAALRLRKEFGEFPELHDLIDAYELRSDEESKFIYALDKIIPVMNIYLDEGHSWKIHDISLDDIIENKKNNLLVELLGFFRSVNKLRRIIPIKDFLEQELNI